MLYLSVILFATAAVLGIYIFSRWFTEKKAPNPVVYSHGIIAAVALIILAYFAFKNPDQFPLISLILFIIAALGGFVLFFLDRLKDKRPLALALVHGLIAVGGFVMLIIFVFA